MSLLNQFLIYHQSSVTKVLQSSGSDTLTYHQKQYQMASFRTEENLFCLIRSIRQALLLALTQCAPALIISLSFHLPTYKMETLAIIKTWSINPYAKWSFALMKTRYFNQFGAMLLEQNKNHSSGIIIN